MNERRISLLERLTVETAMLRGAPEHGQIAGYLREADAYRLSRATTAHLADVLSRNLTSVEQNIDLIRPRSQFTWIEYPDYARRPDNAVPLAGASHPVYVGALVCIDSDNQDQMVILTGWDFPDGSVRHSYAAASLSFTGMSHLAWGARTRFSRANDESLQRLLDQANIQVPPGLAEEIRILEQHDDPDHVEDAVEERLRTARMDVASEVPFVLAALLAVGLSDPVESGGVRPTDVTLKSMPTPFLPWNRTPGFRRMGAKTSPSLKWLEPAA